MSWKQYSLTLTGTAQRLSTVLGVTTPGGEQDQACRQIILAADPANANAVYVGSDDTVSDSNHAFALDPTQATARDRETIGPFDAGPVKLSEFWVLGTASQRLMIGIVAY